MILERLRPMMCFRIASLLTTSLALTREFTANPRPATVKRRLRVRLAIFPLVITLLNAASPKAVSIHTRDPLTLRQGVYSSLLFLADPARAPHTNLPVQYQFTESGATPPGMKFEVYPCNKPGTTVCPQVASANGIFLDGTPAEAGSYTFVITATTVDKKRVSQQFTVTINPPDQVR